MTAVVMLMCQFAANSPLHMPSLAFLRRVGAKPNKHWSNRTSQHRPPHFYSLLCVNMHWRPSRWAEQTTKERMFNQSNVQSNYEPHARECSTDDSKDGPWWGVGGGRCRSRVVYRSMSPLLLSRKRERLPGRSQGIVESSCLPVRADAAFMHFS